MGGRLSIGNWPPPFETRAASLWESGRGPLGLHIGAALSALQDSSTLCVRRGAPVSLSGSHYSSQTCFLTLLVSTFIAWCESKEIICLHRLVGQTLGIPAVILSCRIPQSCGITSAVLWLSHLVGIPRWDLYLAQLPCQ